MKMDSKGRVSIPFFIRNILELDHGDQLILKMNGKKEITATPIKDGSPIFGASIKDLTKPNCTYLVRSK